MLIPQSTVEALRKAHANGHKLFLCTGRNLRMTQPLLDYGFDGAVCSAGGYVFCGDKVLVDLPMEPQLAQDVRSAMERHGVECTLEARDATFGGAKMAQRWSFIHQKNGAPLNSEAERWIHFDYVPGESDIRDGCAMVTGRVCVIGSKLNEPAIAALFGVEH